MYLSYSCVSNVLLTFEFNSFLGLLTYLIITYQYIFSLFWRMKFLKHLWFSALPLVAFICVVAGTERDENSMSTIFTAYPGNLFKRKLITSIGHLQRSFPFKCLRIAEIHQNSDRGKKVLILVFILRGLYLSEGWSAMQQANFTTEQLRVFVRLGYSPGSFRV